MSKSKSSSKGAAPSASNVLTKVKDAAITKPAQTVKAKSKEIAKQVAGKEDKKTKSKKVKEPTPESSEDDSEEEEEDEDDSDDESEAEIRKPVQKGKANGTAKVTKPADSESDESDSSEAEAPTNGHVKAPVVKSAAVESSDDDDSDDSDVGVPTTKAVAAVESSDDDDDEDDSDEDEAPAKNKGPVKAADLSQKLKPVVADNSSDEDSDEEEDDDEADSDEDSDDDSDEVEAKSVQPVKRKAEDDATPAAKKTKTAEVEGADPSQGSNLFVGNLSWNVDEDWLQREFEEFGEISSVRLITDRDTGRSKGFGYVEFVNAAEGKQAHAAKNGAMLDGRALNVDFANQRSQGGQQDRAQSRAKSFGDQASAPSDTLFVGNLSFDAGQESVSEAFSEYGTILGVRLPTDRESGEPKGFGYVTFASVDEAKNALENMQGYEISGRACRLDYSQPRPQNGDSPGRGRGRGGFGDRGGRGRGGFDRGGRGGGRGFGGGRGRGGFDRGGRGGGRGASTNRGGFGDFSGKKVTF